MNTTLGRARKLEIAIIAGLMVAAFSVPALAQEEKRLPGGYPARPIRLIVPWGAGGGTDVIMRVVAAVADKYVAEPVVATIKSGASGTIGHNYVAKSEPDGYTLIAFGSSPVYIAPHFRPIPYDSMRDFTPIIQIANMKIVFCVPASAPIYSVDDFVEAAKKRPGELVIGHAGTESLDYVATKLIAIKSGISIKSIPFEGTGEVVASCAGGHIDGAIGSVEASYPLIEGGHLRPLALVTSTRSEFLPDVPTFKELGYDVALNDRCGIAGPAGLPEPIVKYLHDAFKKTMEDKSFTKLAKRLGLNIEYLSPEEYKKALQEDYAAVALVVKGG